MKVVPVSSPEVRAEVAAQASRQSAQTARERAIAMVSSQAAPVPVDASSVSPEDIGSVTAPSQDISPEATAAAKSEQATPEPKAETKPDETLSNQYNILARKERALRAKAQQQDQALKAKEAALAAREAALEAKDKEYATAYIPKQRLKAETLSVLAEEGLSYDELTQQILNQTPPNPQVDAHIKRLEAKLARLEAQNEESQKSMATAETERYKAAVKQITRDATNLVKTDPNFETVRATNSIRDVVELIEETFKETGEVMSVEEAAQEVENYLVEEAMKLTKIEKIKKRLQAPPAAAAQADRQTPTPPKQTQPMKTLTNATGSTRQLSARERALLAFKGELKS